MKANIATSSWSKQLHAMKGQTSLNLFSGFLSLSTLKMRHSWSLVSSAVNFKIKSFHKSLRYLLAENMLRSKNEVAALYFPVTQTKDNVDSFKKKFYLPGQCELEEIREQL